MDQTVGELLAGMTQGDVRLTGLLSLAGEPNVGARMKALDEMAATAYATLKTFTATPVGVFDQAAWFGCSAAVFDVLNKAHTAAMQARDLYFATDVQPIIHGAKIAVELRQQPSPPDFIERRE